MDLLGPLRVNGRACELELDKSPQLKNVLTTLALAGPLTARQLGDRLHHRSDRSRLDHRTAGKHLQRLRKLVDCVDKVGDSFQLQAGTVVDARVFIDGVGHLGPQTTEAELRTLLALWRADPASAHPHAAHRDLGVWEPVWRARSALIEHLAASPVAAALGPEIEHLTSLFPDDKELDVLRPHPTTCIRRQKCILVVDDTSSDLIADRLDGYRTICLTRYKEWSDFVKSGKLAEVDGALVDLHLKRACNDSEGLIIVDYLRDHTDIPAILMSVNPPPTSNEDFKNDHRLVDVYFKGRRGDENLTKLATDAPQELVSDEERYRRRRLDRFLTSTYYRSRRGLLHPRFGTTAVKRIAKLDRDFSEAQRQIPAGLLERAEEAVRAFEVAWGAGSALRPAAS